MGIVIHDELVQGSDEWLQARCGLLTASELKLALTYTPGKRRKQYRPSEGWRAISMTPKQSEVMASIADRAGSLTDLATIANSNSSMMRKLVGAGAIEQFDAIIPATCGARDDDATRSHVWELAAQRITQYVEPQYVSDAMLRGHEDEILARALYSDKYTPVTEVGFVTNDKWGFTLACSPDGLVGEDGLIEVKSRCQKYQVQTIVQEFTGEATIPDEYVLQVQGQMLVTGRKWCDFVSYSGGLPMAVIRVEADDTIQNAILEAAAKFEARINECVNDFHAAIKARGYHPTERRIEEEMVI